METTEPSRNDNSRARRSFILRVVLPAVLAVILFILATFLLLIPAVENQMLEGKKETTQELTRSAISVIDEYYREEVAGTLTREQAQAEAKVSIEQLRWGDEGKDYFWITDMHPTMIMHPYLPELDGQDLTNYTDQAGNKLFVEMVDVVQKDGSGYVEYYWQYKDDPTQNRPQAFLRRGLQSLAVGGRDRYLPGRRGRGDRQRTAELDLRLPGHRHPCRPTAALQRTPESQDRETKGGRREGPQASRMRSIARWSRLPRKASS